MQTDITWVLTPVQAAQVELALAYARLHPVELENFSATIIPSKAFDGYIDLFNRIVELRGGETVGFSLPEEWQDQEIERCPKCKGICLAETTRQSRIYIRCRACGLRSPDFKTREQAIEFWNKRG